MDIIEIIKQIEADKKSRNVYPTHALYVEISRFQTENLKVELENLVSKNLIETGHTLNDKYYKTKV